MHPSPACVTLSIGGQERTLWFDTIFAEKLFAIVPMDGFDEVIAGAPFRLLPLVTLAGLQAGDDDNSLPDDLSEKTVGRWLMSASADDAAEIIRAFHAGFAHLLGSFLKATKPMAEVVNQAPQAKSTIRATQK